MFNESQLLEQENEETPGQKAEKYVLEFLECHEDLVVLGSAELTEKGGRDDRDGIDAVLSLRRDKEDQEGLLCAIDFTGAGEEKVDEKYQRQHILPFIVRHDEDGKTISLPMPRFILDGVDLEKWNEWGQKADQEGLPITDIIDEQEKHLEEKLFKSMLAKMWVQTKKLSKGSQQERKMILPYKEVLKHQLECYFTSKELEVLYNIA